MTSNDRSLPNCNRCLGSEQWANGSHLSDDPSKSCSTSYAWLVVALLVPVALLNYLDRQMLASMKSSVTDDLGIDAQRQWGTVLALFKWVYAFFSPVAGVLGDRFSRRHIIAGSLCVWSTVTWATGIVNTYEQLLVTRALMGISEALYIPTALAMISDYHPRSTRSRAISIHQMGIYAGIILGGFGGYVADNSNYGWRWFFGFCGLIGVLYSLPLFALLRNASQPGEAEPKLSLKESVLELGIDRGFLLLVLYFTLPAMPAWIIRDWMPSILQDQFRISQGLAGVSATVYAQLAAILGASIGGYWADRWMRSSQRGRIYVSAIGTGLIVPAMFGAGWAPTTGSLAVAIGFLILFGIGWGFFDSNNMPILCQIVRPNLRATGYGIMNLISISFGGVADWTFGFLSDCRVPVWLIFCMFGTLGVVSVLIVLSIRPKHYEPESAS